MNEDKTLIIAEMACSHEGDPNLAIKIIDGAAEACADAVQFQIWSLIHMMAPQRPEYEPLKKIELKRDEWSDLVAYTREKYPKMQIYVCVYEHQSSDFIKSLDIDGFKLNSSDLSNPYVLDKVAATGLPINLSIGASTLTEIQTAIERIKKVSQAKITLMYGYQNFPTAIEDIHLNYMMKIKELFELPIGYQDHCDADTKAAFWIPALSAGMGINVLEKHITHDRSLKGIDYQSALNPDEFKYFVSMVRELEAAKGMSIPKAFSPDELKYRQFQKKSIVAARDLKAGERLQEKDINFLRASELGIAPDKVGKVIHQTVKQDIAAYQIIREDDLL